MDKEVAKKKLEKVREDVRDKLNRLRQIDYQINNDNFEDFFLESKGNISFSDINVPENKMDEIKNKIKEYRLYNFKYRDMNTEELRYWAKRRGVKYITELNNDQLAEILEEKEKTNKNRDYDRPKIDSTIKSTAKSILISRSIAMKKCGAKLKGIYKKKKETEAEYKARKVKYLEWIKKLDNVLMNYRAYRAMNPEQLWDWYEQTGRKDEHIRNLYSLAKDVRNFLKTEPHNKNTRHGG